MFKNVIIFFFFCFSMYLYAQEPLRFSTKQGLPSNHIYDIQEDANGFMWFATNRGLVKYNGETFRTFTIKDGLPNNNTWLLETDYQDRLWYFSKSNYQGFIKNDSIYKFPVENNKVISPRFIHKMKEGLFMISSSGVYKLLKNKIKTVNFLEDVNEVNKKNTEASLKYNFKPNLTSFKVDEKKLICIYKNRLIILNKEYQKIKELTLDLPKNHRNLKIDNQGFLYNDIFYYAMDRGILFVDFKTYKIKFYSFKKLVNAAPIKYFRAKGLKNEIQISFPGHLLKFDYNLNFKESYAFPKVLSKSSYQDSRGNIWLADLTNGVSLIPNTQVKANYYLEGKKVQKINLIDDEIYAGVNDDGFYQFSKQNKTFTKNVSLIKQNGEIYRIEKNNNTLLYISSGGAFVKKGNTYNLIEIFKRPKYFGGNGFKNLVFYKNNFYAIHGSYISKLDNNFNYLKAISNTEGLLQTTIYKNKLFFGGSNGLHLLKNDAIVKVNFKHHLSQTSISTLNATKNNLLVGTDGRGVYVYNNDKVTHLKNTDGFSVQKIIKKENLLWLATNNGVQQLTLNDKDLENSKITNTFYESDGLLQNNTNDIYVDKDTLYAASDIGLAKLIITNPIYKRNPKLYFKTKKDTLSFSNEARRNISISFGLQDYVNQEYINYKYRLLPNQTDWVSTKTKTINFSNLSPKLYTLEVKATDQHFNTTTKKQFVKIVSFWYETKLAIIVFVLLFLLLMFVIFHYIKKQIQKKAAAKTAQDKRIAGLELQALRSQMNPHFVHNSLNAIQYFIQRNEVELSENYLSKFSLLIRLFFEYSRRQNITLKEEIKLLENYLEIEKLRFEEKLSYQINVDESLDTEEMIIPAMILQPIVENAVNHGLFHKKENGNITIYFNYIDQKTYQVKIYDDGIGIKKSKEIYKNSTKNYRSNSTEVLKERLQLLEQSNMWQIAYELNDFSETEHKEGTQVSIIFKQTAL